MLQDICFGHPEKTARRARGRSRIRGERAGLKIGLPIFTIEVDSAPQIASGVNTCHPKASSAHGAERHFAWQIRGDEPAVLPVEKQGAVRQDRSFHLVDAQVGALRALRLNHHDWQHASGRDNE